MDKIIEKFGIYFDEVGFNKTYGRMFGFFMTSTKPISMKTLVDKLQISKSTASIELRNLLSTGVIEKVLIKDERADFYRLKKNIWSLHLQQKIQDIKKLRTIIEEISSKDLKDLENLEEMIDYCAFLEPELETLTKKYNDFQKKNTMKQTRFYGSYIEESKENKKFIIDWIRLPALSKTFADKMASVSALGIESFTEVEIDFLLSHPQAIEEDKSLSTLSGLEGNELQEFIHSKLHKIFHTRLEDVNEELKVFMADVYYYFVTIKEEKSEKVQGFITFMHGGIIPQNEYKITAFAVEKNFRQMGMGRFLMNSLNKIGIKYKKIFASTRPSNSIAIKVYKNLGFIEDLEAEKMASPHFIKGHWVHLAHY